MLEEIKAIEQDNKSKEGEIESTKTQTQTVPIIKPEIIVELDDEEAECCKDCKRGLHLRCPSCKDDFISCQYYKNPYLRRINSKACENYE